MRFRLRAAPALLLRGVGRCLELVAASGRWAGLGWAGLGQLLCAFSPAEHDAGLCSAEGLLLKGAAAFRRRKHLPREGGRQRSAHASEEMGTGHEMVVETVCK